MTDPGLNHRLRQRSRRAGIMIGISMALTIAVCVAGFSVIYSALDSFTGDFVSRDAPTSVPPTVPAANNDVAANPNGQPQPTATVAAQPTVEPTVPAATATPSAFTPDYQITSSSSVYLRSGPGTDNDPVTTLSPQTQLQFLGDREKTANPDADGFSGDWMKFKDENGEEGWVREIDVGAYQP